MFWVVLIIFNETSYITIVIRIDGLETHQNNNITHYLCLSTFIHKSGRSPPRVYCIFAQLINYSNVLGKLPIRDSTNRVNWKLLLMDLAKKKYT
jgi:hypothetical protein